MTFSPEIATSYDSVAPEHQARFVDQLDEKPRDRELLDALAARTTGIVLDVGSGPGHIGRRVRSDGKHVVAVDLSQSMASLANARLDGAVVATLR